MEIKRITLICVNCDAVIEMAQRGDSCPICGESEFVESDNG